MSAQQDCNQNNLGNANRCSGFGSVKAAFGGAFLALALILAYAESLLPLNFGIPGIKIGLPNIAILFLLYRYGFLFAGTVSLARIIIASMLFGNITGFIYSLSGGILSLSVMCLLKRTDKFSPVGVSVAGGISHNVAQIIAASFVLGADEILYYLPMLIIGGVISGIAVGALGGVLIKKIK